jgi:predicted SprT family Zn-dependent metalloprotease
MKEIRLRSFSYRCSCGYEVRVFLDFGVPQEVFKCRMCGGSVSRKEC